MDDQIQEQMKSVGIHGLISISFKTIFMCNKIFAQITITLILPLTIIFIAHMHLSTLYFDKIEKNPYQLFTDVFNCYQTYFSVHASKTSWLYYLLFKCISISTLSTFSILSTAVIVYIIASAYIGRDITFRKSIKVVPKVWKRLTITFFLMYLMFCTYNLLISVIIFFLKVICGKYALYFWGVCVIVCVYVSGLWYLTLIWQLAIVVCVLENRYGLKSMIKAMDLIKGKSKVALVTLIEVYVNLGVLVFIYMSSVMYTDGGLALMWRVMMGIIIVVLIVIEFLLIIVMETMVYLVCKSYHQEAIDPVSLSTYLGSYLNDSQPASRVGEGIQLGRPQNQLVSQV